MFKSDAAREDLFGFRDVRLKQTISMAWKRFLGTFSFEIEALGSDVALEQLFSCINLSELFLVVGLATVTTKVGAARWAAVVDIHALVDATRNLR